MQFTTAQLAEIQEQTAQKLADIIIDRIGDLEAYVVFPMSTASSLLGLSTKQIPVYLPITSTAAGKKGVTLAAIRRHIDTRTSPPTGLRYKKQTNPTT